MASKELGKPQQKESLAKRVFGIEHPQSREDSLTLAYQQDVENSLTTAYETLTGKKVSAKQIADKSQSLTEYFKRVDEKKGDYGAYDIDVETEETGITSAALINIFQKKKTKFSTTLSSWPLYEDFLTRYGRKKELEHTDPLTNNALLVGSLSRLSSEAFGTFAEDVLGTEKAYVVDIRSSEAKKHPEHSTFQYGDGLHLPFRKGSMRFVHTNRLLHMILENGERPDANSESEQAVTGKLFKELFRVLTPGGQLLLQETPPRFDFHDRNCKTEFNQTRVQEFKTIIKTELQKAGFTNIAIKPGWELRGVSYLFDQERQFNQYPKVLSPMALGIYAYKEHSEAKT